MIVFSIFLVISQYNIVFGEELHIDKTTYMRGEVIIIHVTNNNEEIKLIAIRPDGSKYTGTFDVEGNQDVMMIASDIQSDSNGHEVTRSGTYTIQGKEDSVSFTLDAGTSDDDSLVITDYLFYKNQFFQPNVSFDYMLPSEPITLEILDPTGNSIGTKTIPINSSGNGAIINMSDFAFEKVGKYLVTVTHAGKTFYEEIYYAGEQPIINTSGEYSLRTIHHGIQKIPVTIENGHAYLGYNNIISQKDASIQLDFSSFQDQGTIILDMPKIIIDAVNIPFIVTIDNKKIEHEEIHNSNSNKLIIPFQFEEKYDTMMTGGGMIARNHQVTIQGTHLEGNKQKTIQDKLYLINKLPRLEIHCAGADTSFTLEGNMICAGTVSFIIVSPENKILVQSGNLEYPSVVSTDMTGNIYILDKPKSQYDSSSTRIQKYSDEGRFIKIIKDESETSGIQSMFVGYDNFLYTADRSGLFTKLTLDGEIVAEKIKYPPPPRSVVDSYGNYYGMCNSFLCKYTTFVESPEIRDIIFTLGVDGIPETIYSNHNTDFGRVSVDSKDNVYVNFPGKLQKFTSDGQLLLDYQTNERFEAINPDDSIFMSDSNYNLVQYAFEESLVESNSTTTNIKPTLVPTEPVPTEPVPTEPVPFETKSVESVSATEPQPTHQLVPTCGHGTELVDGTCQVIKTEGTSKGGGCLIATATYGSELAPQVQQLRELRDNSLLQTVSGTSFMSGFNDFYYSFSPTIADWERENPVFKEMVKITITPMISSLSILNYVDMDSEVSVLGYGISLIILNVGMYFVAPAVVIHKVRKKF